MKIGGVIPSLGSRTVSATSPRSRGIKQGLFIFLLTFLIVPIVAITTVALHLGPFGIPIAAILLFVGGLLRMAYAAMFESATPAGLPAESPVMNPLRGDSPVNVLPPQQSFPIESYAAPAAGKWRDTNELQPVSVTEDTTRLLSPED
ncbi:MAG: hypothetical protein ABI878_12450 [Acidobacteriota bacterium]